MDGSIDMDSEVVVAKVKQTRSSKGRTLRNTRAPVRPSAHASVRPSGRAPIQLRWLAHARSGDKGDTANVGLIALKPGWYDLLRREVTPARVARHFKGMISGVERFELPNLRALNFLLHGALDGGGTLSLKTDAQGKVYSTALLRMRIPVPAAIRLTLPRAAQEPTS
ncbi:MAG: AtuA-related protein [Gemmatimonadales bacterium]